MKKTIVKISFIVVTACFIGAIAAQEHVTVVEIPSISESVPDIIPAKPLVQMAILLDTSGSMSGLIDQARTELWAIVNEFIFAKRNGMEPNLQVALYQYGKGSFPVEDGYIRQIIPFTTDLDKVSEELFALTIGGSKEYCGWVIQEATKSLQWSDSPDDLKVIFIAGNEPFTQGPIDYNKSCKEAIAKGIIVNTIHCGSEREGLEGHWKDGAVLADGDFLNIDHNRQVVHIAAPQDEEIARLNIELNDTYIAYGAGGQAAQQRQAEQDRNAANLSPQASTSRAVTKSSFNYRNSSWDLVDALKENQVELENIQDKDLPENMQNMTIEERKTYTDEKAKERAEIQKKIQELNVQRENYVAAERKKQQGGENTLGSAIIKAVQNQAVRKNFEFNKPEIAPENSNPAQNQQ